MCWPEPRPAVPSVALVRIGLEPGDHLLEVLGREVLAHDGDVGIVRQAHDRLEIPLEVVVEVVDRAVGDERRPVADADRVAVGRGAHHAADADGAVRAGDVLDHDGLAEMRPHRLGHGAAHGVGRAAGAVGHDERDRPRRIGLCAREAGERQDCEGQLPRHSRFIAHLSGRHAGARTIAPLLANAGKPTIAGRNDSVLPVRAGQARRCRR